MTNGPDRPLTDAERNVLLHMLSAPFPGAAELRAQIVHARVIKNWEPAGSPSIDVFVPAGSPRASIPDGLAPVTAQVIDREGSYLGELLLWVVGGKISALEYSWVTDESPDQLPETSWIRVSPPS